MKKLITLILAIGVLGGLGYYVVQLNANKGKSDTELIEFAIKDTKNVDKVIIHDSFGRTFEIIKGAKEWTDKDGGCIQQTSVENILKAIRNIEFKGYLPENSHEKYNLQMAAQNTKVEIFEHGEWVKTWYMGPSATDHYGQIMILDSKEFGMSDNPVIMKLKGVHGIIEPRFFADSKKWLCTNIFAVENHNIKEVDVKFNDNPKKSFTVKKDGFDLSVFNNDVQLQNVDTAMIFRYLNNYKKIHFDIANYELPPEKVDSMKSTTPFCELTLTETNGTSTKLNCFRIKLSEYTTEGLVEYHDIDKDRFWIELPSGEMVKCQYFVFNPLFYGHIYFPMEVPEDEFQ
ncbi:MAG: hypothetical protein MK105_16570 [Crocinitomicaceae bacterium]|nr:hypothetical protein [Crocinitomicaceae bacterium]